MWEKISDILPFAIALAVAGGVVIYVARKAKGPGKRKNFTEHTVGILRSVQRTGLYINEQPQLSVTFDAVLQDGATTPVVVTEIVSLTDLKLTGEEEDGCREVKITARIDEKGGGERILERTSWMTDAEIEALTVGKLVTLQIVEDDPPWFSVLQLTDRAFSGE